MRAVIQDLRYAVRALARTPGFSGIALATLAVGIGAVVAVFSVARAVLLKPLPYRDPARLVRIGHVASAAPVRPGSSFSPQDFEDLDRDHSGLDAVAAYSYFPNQSGKNLTGAGEPARIVAAEVSGAFFPLLGVSAFLGRALAPADDRPGNDHVVVLGFALWQRRFGGDPAVVGRPVWLDGVPYTVAGVMPPAFALPFADVEAWVPLSTVSEDAVPHRREVRWLSVIGRLARGTDVPAVRAALDGLFGRLAARYPASNAGFERAAVVPLRETVVGDVRPAILVLLGAVVLVLSIAASNIANLLLARASVRHREMAVRAALGASRGRLVRQLLTEGLALSLAGGALGILLARWGMDALVAAAGAHVPRAAEISMDGGVLAFAVGLSTLVGVLFGLAPAVQASRTGLFAAMQSSGARGSTGGRAAGRLREALVISQIALAAVLLFGAGLLARSFWRLAHVASGIAPESVLAFSISIPDAKYPDEKMERYRDAILDSIRALPGVAAVGASKTMPLEGGGEAYGFTLEGAEAGKPIHLEEGTIIVTRGYFSALGIPVRRGRDFTDADFTSSAPVLLINEALARRLFPGVNPVGRALVLGGRFRFEVIGVAGDVRHGGLAATPGAAVYVPASRFPRSIVKVFVRAAGDPAALAASVRTTIHRLDPDQPISGLAPLSEMVSSNAARPRLLASLVGTFSAAALLLAGLGIYGVISYGVALRTREIGVRIALGADPAAVRRLIFRDTLRIAAVGLAAGAVAAGAASGALRALLFEVPIVDPPTIAAAAALLVGAAAAACLLPAGRAARVDPVTALKAE